MADLLHRLVDRAAERDEAREAYCVPGERISYGELAARTSRLAHLLIEAGVEPGDRVGILMPRCLETAVAVHGVLKAGAVFVPIDPRVPAAALETLVESCDIAAVVTVDAAADRLEALGSSSSLRLVVGASARSDRGTRPWSDLDAFPSTAPNVERAASDPAYIMFSSGSTGRPKGIAHTHGSGLAYARLSVATYGVVPDDRIGNHSPLHFDMSTFGYLSSPLAGATTLIVPEAYTKMPASLSQLVERERLTIWYSVPLALLQLLRRGALEERDLGALRWVLYGGEPMARRTARSLLEHCPKAKLSNVYGPAEVNQCTYHHLTLEELRGGEDEAPIPIGRTWDETEALILDGEGGPADEGELLIRSPTMMRGYWARPDLDERVFHDEAGSGRFYRTGDLVRRDAEGDLVFLGRLDRQVKVRGYRVELEEVERTLGAHPAVEEVAVVPVHVNGEVDHLGAAVRVVPGESLEADALRGFAADLVSWYAVPRTVEVVETLPRTGSDKVDRNAVQARLEARFERAVGEVSRQG